MERSRFQYYALTIQESLRCSLDSRGILRRSLPSKETLSQQWLFLVTQPKTALQVPSNSCKFEVLSGTANLTIGTPDKPCDFTAGATICVYYPAATPIHLKILPPRDQQV
ncbi:uncharacterized protein [Physcomitrium patens]|uniref:uncharacterized protein isoform X2 n=1 Tax=Physcomitrium patens TaxID=3218 RepID=UPI003CCE0F27